MLGRRALCYYNEGWGCSASILKACEEEYNIKISEDCIKGCEVFSNGMGIGICCGVFIACVMAIGILCDDVPYCRLEMAEKFKREMNDFDCCKIKDREGCENIIAKSCDILNDIIDKGIKKY